MVRKRRSFFHTNVTPTTGARLTHVRNPRAGSRFSPGDHVRWCDEEAIFISEDPRDPTIAIVRLIPSGRVTEWPGALAGMRRMQTANYDTPPALDQMVAELPIAGELTNVFRQASELAEPPALPVPLDDHDYEDIETFADLGDTLTDIENRKKR
jgi:hypothetical protein